MNISDLDEMIRAVCPIYGCSSDGSIWFKDDATEEQKTSAVSILESNISNITCGECRQEPSSAKILADALVDKGVITQAEIDAVASENGVVFCDK